MASCHGRSCGPADRSSRFRTGRRLSRVFRCRPASRSRQEPGKAAAWPLLSRGQTPDPHGAPSQTVPACARRQQHARAAKTPSFSGFSVLGAVPARCRRRTVAAGNAPAGAAEMMDVTVRTVSMVCTLMIVLSRCFYGHLVFACGNETRHGRGNGSNGNRAGRCSRNRNPNSGIRGASRAKKEVKAPNGGHHDTQHKGGL